MNYIYIIGASVVVILALVLGLYFGLKKKSGSSSNNGGGGSGSGGNSTTCSPVCVSPLVCKNKLCVVDNSTPQNLTILYKPAGGQNNYMSLVERGSDGSYDVHMVNYDGYGTPIMAGAIFQNLGAPSLKLLNIDLYIKYGNTNNKNNFQFISSYGNFNEQSVNNVLATDGNGNIGLNEGSYNKPLDISIVPNSDGTSKIYDNNSSKYFTVAPSWNLTLTDNGSNFTVLYNTERAYAENQDGKCPCINVCGFNWGSHLPGDWKGATCAGSIDSDFVTHACDATPNKDNFCLCQRNDSQDYKSCGRNSTDMCNVGTPGNSSGTC